jgi:hypothetical protein
MMTIDELSQLIKANPGAILVLDNDDWSLYRKPFKPVIDMSDDEHDEWASMAPLARSSDISERMSAHDSIIRAFAMVNKISVEKA